MTPRRLLVVLCVALVVVAATVAPVQAAPQPLVPQPGPKIDRAVDSAMSASGSARVIVTYRTPPSQPDAFAGVHRVLDGGRVLARTATAGDLDALRTDPKVSAVVLDQVRSIEDFPDPGWEHLPTHLNSPPVADPNIGTGQVVAVVDTGVLSAHSYFTNNGTTATRVLPGACFASSESGGGDCPNGQTTQIGPGSAEPCLGASECTHGTHVAGIVAGRAGPLRGVAPGAQILPIRVFNVFPGGASAFDSDVLSGLYYVYEHRNDFPSLAAVNLSLGGGHSTTACDNDPSMGLYVDVIGRLRANGVATTIADGNSLPGQPGSPNSVAFPSCVSAAITVAASTSTSGGVETVASSFSDRLFGVTDFVAPGDEILSSFSDSSASFGRLDGTSMAAPMIAGAIADIRSAKPAIPYNELGFNAIVDGLLQRAATVSDGTHNYKRPDITKAIADTPIPSDTTVPNDPSPITGRFIPVTPQRLVDTRQGSGQRVQAGAVRFIAFDDGDVLPAGAAAAALNVTVVNPGSGGFLTVFPCIADASPKAPDTSNVNFAAGQTVANLVVVGISASSEVCFQGNAAMDVIVDLMGWYGGAQVGASFGAVTPARALDTRSSNRLAAGEIRPVPLAGHFGLPANAVAAVLNVTAADANADGFLTVFPCAGGVPDTSNVNFVTGRAVPNQVLVGLAAGQVCVTTSEPANVLVDVSGYYAAPPVGTGRFTPIVPGRLIDTRSSTKPPARSVVTVPTLGQHGVPADATAVALNVTVDGATGLGFLTVFPCASTPPDASNLNYVAGLTVANSVTMGIGQGGAVCVYTEASANVLVDVTGYYGP